MSRILIVDDRPEELDRLAAIVRDVGESPTFARTMAEALRMMHTKPFDLIITGIETTGGDEAFRLLRTALAIDPDTQVIILTDNQNADRGVYALTSGAIDYLRREPLHDYLALLPGRIRNTLKMRTRLQQPRRAYL